MCLSEFLYHIYPQCLFLEPFVNGDFAIYREKAKPLKKGPVVKAEGETESTSYPFFFEFRFFF